MVKKLVSTMPVSAGIVRGYVPGETTQSVVDASAREVDEGIRATLDFLGEDTLDSEQADATVSAYLEVLSELSARGLTRMVEVSVKLSAIGQALPDNGHLYAPHVINDIWRLTEGNAIVVTDVGQHQMWEAQYYHHEKPRTLITSGGLGTMGFGLPAAIGAKMARPDAEVWAIVGDGGFQMTQPELSTAAQEGVKVNVAIINNGYLGMVRQW